MSKRNFHDGQKVIVGPICGMTKPRPAVIEGLSMYGGFIPDGRDRYRVRFDADVIGCEYLLSVCEDWIHPVSAISGTP